jgi:hypothetical protein
MNTIFVESIRRQIQRDINFFVSELFMFKSVSFFNSHTHIALNVEVTHKNSDFAFDRSLHVVCSVHHSHAVISKCTLIIFNKHAICFVQFFTNGPLFLHNFGDLQQRLNHLQLV